MYCIVSKEIHVMKLKPKNEKIKIKLMFLHHIFIETYKILV
jgi:hypothetical protein